MTSGSSWYGSELLRRLRGPWVVALAVLYLCVGPLHAFAHADAATVPATTSVVAMTVAGDSGVASHGIVAGHHCDGCLSITLPVLAVTSDTIAPPALLLAQAVTLVPEAPPGLDTPPPKS